MGLDSSEDIEYGEGGVAEKGQETAKETQERKEKTSKGMAGIQRTRKDEKRAHKDNDFLYKIIISILQNKKFDVLLPFISDLLKNNIPSNLIIGGISLIYDKATYIIRTNYIHGNSVLVINENKAREFKITINYEPTSDVVEFDDSNLHEAIKGRVNEWIEDIINVISFDPSSIITKKFFEQIHNNDTKKIIINYLASVLTFFLFELNIVITKEKAFLYSEFILSEIVKKLKSLKLEEIS